MREISKREREREKDFILKNIDQYQSITNKIDYLSQKISYIFILF